MDGSAERPLSGAVPHIMCYDEYDDVREIEVVCAFVTLATTTRPAGTITHHESAFKVVSLFCLHLLLACAVADLSYFA